VNNVVYYHRYNVRIKQKVFPCENPPEITTYQTRT